MKMPARLTLAALLSLALAPCLASAQGEKLAKAEAEAAAAPAKADAPKPQPQPLLLTITVKESDSGKATIERSYTFTEMADDSRFNQENLRDGDRIPYMGEKGREYYDVGTNIDIDSVSRRGEAVAFNLRVESSSLAAKTDGVNLPQVSHWRMTVAAVLLPGKPTVVYSATNAMTAHKVEIQATAQLLNGK